MIITKKPVKRWCAAGMTGALVALLLCSCSTTTEQAAIVSTPRPLVVSHPLPDTTRLQAAQNEQEYLKALEIYTAQAARDFRDMELKLDEIR